VRKLVETMVKGMVSHPEHVEVVENHSGRVHQFEVRVDEEDRGRVIGRHGATASALRTLASGVARRKGVRVEIDIVD
jgi:hypothetical protein